MLSQVRAFSSTFTYLKLGNGFDESFPRLKSENTCLICSALKKQIRSSSATVTVDFSAKNHHKKIDEFLLKTTICPGLHQ